MRWRTANQNRRRRERVEAYEAAFRFHEQRVRRLMRSGGLHKLAMSRYVLRQRRVARARALAAAYGMSAKKWARNRMREEGH